MKHLLYIFKILVALMVLSSCVKNELEPIDPTQDEMVTVRIPIDNDFGTQTISTKSSRANMIATSRERDIKSCRILVFENENGSSISPDPNGRLLVYEEGEIGVSEFNFRLLPIPDKKLSIIAIANLPQSVYSSIQSEFEVDFDDPNYITYSKFIELSRVKLDTEVDADGLTTIATPFVLENSDDGLLPVSVDPIQLDELTKESMAAHTFTSNFGYTRVDILVDPASASADDIELIGASLLNVPNIPVYFGNPTDLDYIDHTKLQTRDQNINTAEQPDAEGSKHIIQGLYTYPIHLEGSSVGEHQVFVVIKAITAVSGAEGEYYKVLLEYEVNGVVTNSLYRDTRYRLVIGDFQGNGYATFKEAFDGEPSNVTYEIEIDNTSGNEFVVTNGTMYMALSNTRTDLYGTDDKLFEREIPLFSVFYAKNSSEAVSIIDPKKSIHITEDCGIEIIDAENIDTNLKAGEHYNVVVKITDLDKWKAANRTATIIMRIGDLVQDITFSQFVLDNNATSIPRYQDADYIYGYLEFVDPADYAYWVLFNGNNVLEYESIGDLGIPITFSALVTGNRDNFKSPIFLYKTDGSSTKVLVYQEFFSTLDFSSIDFVKNYIGGSMNDASVTELTKDYLSNCYILNPAPDSARKYYIPISSRIKHVWDTYSRNNELDPYKGSDGTFELPQGWKCKTIWYDSQRIYDSGIKFERDTPNPKTGEERMSIIIPAKMQNYGNMLVAVTDEDDNILWAWSFWLTDYDPTSIARNANPTNGVGSYGAGGAFSAPSMGRVYDNAIHRYENGIWDAGSLNGDRFIMDRNLGAFENSSIGHGTLFDANNQHCIADPIAGMCFYQFGNPRPFPGTGAVKDDGTPITNFPSSTTGYTTVIGCAQDPYTFFIGLVGSGKYSHWLDPDDPSYSRDLICGDVDLKVNLTLDETEINRAKKSIFDPSPLGWMMASKSTFTDLTSTNTPRDGAAVAPYTYSTLVLYKKFAYYYYTSYRGSDTGVIVKAKSNGGADVYIRTNETLNSIVSTTTPYRDALSYTIHSQSNGSSYSVQGTGKAAGLAVRSITQSEY